MSRRGQGLAKARNAALAATTADVLAFVDDDVAVQPGWLAALQRAWANAPATAASSARRSACASRAAAALADRRAAGRARRRRGGRSSFHGGNVSFRTDALRGVQGFWPAAGRPELHDWFSEEHYAQHELTAAGWSRAREPGARAVRIVDPARLRRRDVLKCRAATERARP